MTTTNLTARRTLFTGALVLALAVGASLALAQGPGAGQGKGARHGQGRHGGCGDGRGPGLEMMTARLDLTAEQQEAIGKLQDEARARRLETRKEMMRLQNELEGELMKDEPGEKTVMGLAAKIGELRTAQQQSRLATRLAVREQLTPEQRDRMLTMRAGSGPRGGREHARHGGHGRSGGHGRGCDRRGSCRQDAD
jgi:Spy/CpxP family protein refolding chaperone